MTSLYDLTADTFKRVLESTIHLLEKGAQFFEEQGTDPADILEMRLAPDMLPFPFQINSIRHNTLGTIQALVSGQFSPPDKTPELSYSGYIDWLKEALAQVNAVKPETIAALEGKTVSFKTPRFEMSFTAENFVVSFVLPNLYFHATTTYDMLRIKGVPLGKLDFLGNMKAGVPDA